MEAAAQSSGYRTYRYTMLRGKTLTHIAQECRRLVAELAASNPEKSVATTDVSLLLIEAMGTAWKPSTLNSVDHVTARIRNGLEILASLAGMPQVSAVHIHSNPSSYIYNLRPEYNVVMTQALNEADEKGMTTVCVDTLAQLLVLQDGYHARDTCDNRALFAHYLVNTLLLMDREIQAARLRPGIDALMHTFRHDGKAFKPNEATQKIGEEMAATIKRIQDEQEAQIQARINARSSGQPVASVAIKSGSGLTEAVPRPIGRSKRGALKLKGTCAVTWQTMTWTSKPRLFFQT